MITTLAISVVWIVYSMIPPVLLLWYTFIGRGTTLKLLCRCALTLYPTEHLPTTRGHSSKPVCHRWYALHWSRPTLKLLCRCALPTTVTVCFVGTL